VAAPKNDELNFMNAPDKSAKVGGFGGGAAAPDFVNVFNRLGQNPVPVKANPTPVAAPV